MNREAISLSIAIPSLLNNVDVVSVCIEESLKNYLDDEQLYWVSFALREIVVNAIVHGNLSDEKKPVVVEMSFENDTLEFCVKDKGRGFLEKDLICHEKFIEKLDYERGLGNVLVKKLMDSIECRKERNWFVVKLLKRLGGKK